MDILDILRYIDLMSCMFELITLRHCVSCDGHLFTYAPVTKTIQLCKGSAAVT